MTRLALLLLASPLLSAQIEEISGQRIRAHVRFLASDLLEGRGVGARGGDLATEYLATQFALLGAKSAGDNSTYFQRVPLVGVHTQPQSALTVTRGGQPVKLRWLEDFVGGTERQQPAVAFNGEVVFVGHGITAPEFQWDDYRDTDVRGKVVLLFTNEPPSQDEGFFGGRALTYYGRWVYKYENALRHGAAACVIIHTTPTAGYGYEVVRSSWSREDPQVALKTGETGLAFAGWVTNEAARTLLEGSGQTVEGLLQAADTRGFRPMPLPLRVAGNLVSRVRPIETRNVAALLPGSDPQLSQEVVLYSAHWDHLGVGSPVGGDAIYNGAVDNATGCAMLLEIARSWAQREPRPKRSALFLAVTAEESGLRGSAYYAANPLIAPERTALALNYDAISPFGRTRDLVVTGAERTTAWPLVQQIASRFQLTIKPDPRPEQGSFYRSDHFSFAKRGIAAFSVHNGNEFLGKPADYGTRVFQEFNQKRYHQPSDEYNDSWDFAGMEHLARFGLVLGTEAANGPKGFAWTTKP